MKMSRILILFLVIVFLSSLLPIGSGVLADATPITFSGEELLGRPTDNSITINIVPDDNIDVYYEYGTSPGVYGTSTPILLATGGEPHEIVISGLAPNTRYYYRMLYQQPGETGWIIRDEHTFHTQRIPGSTFTFTIIADSHMSGGGGSESLYVQTLNNVLADNPDFHFDLGDTFWTDSVTTVAATEQKYLAQRAWMSIISHSAPIFIATGNHENEEGWNFDDSPSKALLSVNARKLYYPNPITDGFYTGNDDTLAEIDGDHLRENYYAWEWGDALFVVIDPFQYTMIKPYAGTAGGEDNDETVSNDRWDWTLGDEQYQWFKDTLEGSSATFKFVFAHHVTGGTYDYVRGGAEAAPYFEWGGKNLDDTWGFDTERPTWDVPIHQLMVDNGVSAFFHGHDHEYAYEQLDGVVYQLVPAPSMTGYGFNLYSESDPYTIKVLPNSGHLRVTVSPTQATVDYVATSDGTVNYSYDILAGEAPTYTLTVNTVGNGSVSLNPAGGTYPSGTVVTLTATADPGWTFSTWGGDGTGDAPGTRSVTMDGDKSVAATFTVETGILGDVNGDDTVNSTDALIILSCDVGIDTSAYCPMNCGDVNDDGLINSTDALIILSYDVGIYVPYPVGEPGYPSSVTPCPGCSP